MFELPVSDEPLRVLSVDPGSYNTGFAKFNWDCVGDTVSVCDAYTLQISERDPRYSLVRDKHSARIARLLHLQDEFYTLLNEYQPHVVVAESNYLGRFADAYATLVECVAVVRNTLYQYDPHLPLIMVGPSEAKKAAGVVGRKSEKIDVAIALKKRTDINWGVDIDTLDEHSVDAIAIGYYAMLAFKGITV